MKKIYLHSSLLLLLFFLSELKLAAQCATTVTIGTASNMFTLIRNGNHPISIDKNLNLVAFVHRNNAGLFGGNSGELRYDYSGNAGTTWTLNQGVVNPSIANYARYPNMAIYNPTSNVNPANAYISYLAPTINTSTSAWNGVVTGVEILSGGVPTEAYNQNGIGTDQIPHSMVKSVPGVFWAIDPITILATGYNIYRGVWSNTTNDVVWSVNTTVSPPFVSTWSSAGQIVDYNIAFDPTGQIGYFSFLGHVTGGPTASAIYPILYKTTNGGVTWTGPIQADVSGFGCITSNLASGANASCNTEHDLIVDANGIPHIITTLGSATNYIFNYTSWHHMYDITLNSGLWVAHDLGNVNGAPNTMGVSPNTAVQTQAPQAARSADGTKLFFTWTDNANYALGAANTLPQLYSKAYNVTTGNWTPTKNFTSCNSSISGLIWFPHIAPEVFEPSATSWKIAGVFGQPLVTNDLLQQANFYFLDNLTYASSEFTVAVPPATVTIAQAPTLIYCPNTTVNINVTGAGQVIWSNSITTNPLPISTGSISTYSVIAQVGCLVGTASINVTNLSVSAGALTSTVCPGGAVTFTAAGNAFTYSWSPGLMTGTNVVLNPTSGSATLTATGSSSCAVSTTVPINILPAPSLTIAGSASVCAGYVLTKTVTGAQSYLWSNGSSNSTYTAIATTNTIIGVVGTAANSCTNTATVSVIVNPTPTVSASSSGTSICVGQTVTLFGTGSANSYSWNGNATGPNLISTPIVNTTYTLTGSNNFGCIGINTLQVIVFQLPTLSVTPSRTFVCKNEKVNLTASGANTYTWVTQGVISPSIVFTPNQAQTYSLSVILMSTDGCVNTGTFVMIASACTGIEEQQTVRSWELWPNPSNGNFQIRSNESKQLLIVNALGQKISEINLLPGTTNISSDLANGIYFIYDIDHPETKGMRFVVEK